MVIFDYFDYFDHFDHFDHFGYFDRFDHFLTTGPVGRQERQVLDRIGESIVLDHVALHVRFV